MPPISSICSLVNIRKAEFLPTTASNEMYETDFVPGRTFQWLGVIGTVAGMVTVRASFCEIPVGNKRDK